MITSTHGTATRVPRSPKSVPPRDPSLATPHAVGEAPESRPVGGLGAALQTLLNVTIDCVRGRYDR